MDGNQNEIQIPFALQVILFVVFSTPVGFIIWEVIN
jgi:hypothetical protein